MALKYPEAIEIIDQEKLRFPFGRVVATTEGKSYIATGFALHSEDLTPMAVLLSNPETAQWDVAPAKSLSSSLVRMIQVAGTFDIDSLFKMDAFRHVKGQVYTRLLRNITGRKTGPMTLYIGHRDGRMWLRPQEMFEDGRFLPSSDRPLTLDDMGMHRL
jgi:hypothetical protein